MGTNECSQPASKSSWDSQDFGDVNMVLKMLHFHKSSRPQWVKHCPIMLATGPSCQLLLLENHQPLMQINLAKSGFIPISHTT